MSWNGVKKQSYEQEIRSWCREMGIDKYTINSQGEIDVDDEVWLNKKDFKELPYKFGKVNGFFNLQHCKNLTSLKNCPNEVIGYFACSFCSKLDSLEGCPNKVKGNFWCKNCKRQFTKEEVRSLCEVKMSIYN